MKKYKFSVNGMHCKSCVVLTESELNELPHVRGAKANLRDCCVEVEGEFGDKNPEDVAAELSAVMERHGYSITVEKIRKENIKRWSEFLMAIPIALLFMGFFIVLQKLGIVNIAASEEVGYSTAFIVGIVASLSTCMAVVGGLVLSLSANYAKSGTSYRPHIMFHVGRLIAFFFLGGVIGAIGASFALSGSVMFLLTLAVGIVLLLLGINLLDIFSWSSRFIPAMPKFISNFALTKKNTEGFAAPFLLGAITFFLPCGFTQSMQIYTLGSGSFERGALTMLFFALGTLPVLLALSFGAKKMSQGNKSGVFFKTAGIVVIFFALINIMNSLAVAGIIQPLFNF